MQFLLGCNSVVAVLLHIWPLLTDVEEFDTSEHSVMYCSLVFIESMLDQIMDIECSMAVQKSLIELLALILDKTCFSTVLCEKICHILD